ncbi:MAG: electron transfer flavoprotein subunit alpha [Eubacteriales bacterium]|nr:electron transfer flavoprotein subunit alpha [Eubacteriales bacterium]
MIHIDSESCIGCGVCAETCFSGAISIQDSRAVVNDACILCGSCEDACPVSAITFERDSEAADKNDLSAYSGVWVVMENDNHTSMPKKVCYELLSEGRKLADRLGERLCAVYLCIEISEQTVEDLRAIGCDILILAENSEFKWYNTDVFSKIITGFIEKYKPSIVLYPGTENGRDLAPRISARLKVGLTADCTALEINEKKELVQVRPTYGGNIVASILTPDHRPQMASVRPNIFAVVRTDTHRKMEILREQVTITSELLRVKRAGTQEKKSIYKDVEEARVVLVGGFGAGEKGFQLINELAVKLDAAVGATRKAVDEGWAPFEIQIGQTGKIIAPDLYICFGVSGALQHTIGVRGAKKMIAVNNDPTAPVFNCCDMAVLGDCVEVLENMIKQVEEKGNEVFSI